MPFIIPVSTPTPSTQPAGSDGLNATPQFDAPFRLNNQGRVATVQQGSPADVAAQIYNVLICPQGAKLADPAFGINSPLGAVVPINTNPIVKQIQALVPGAIDVSVVQQALTLAKQQPVMLDVAAGVAQQ